MDRLSDPKMSTVPFASLRYAPAPSSVMVIELSAPLMSSFNHWCGLAWSSWMTNAPPEVLSLGMVNRTSPAPPAGVPVLTMKSPLVVGLKTKSPFVMSMALCLPAPSVLTPTLMPVMSLALVNTLVLRFMSSPTTFAFGVRVAGTDMLRMLPPMLTPPPSATKLTGRTAPPSLVTLMTLPAV